MQGFESDTQIILLSADSFTLFLSYISPAGHFDISNLLGFFPRYSNVSMGNSLEQYSGRKEDIEVVLP